MMFRRSVVHRRRCFWLSWRTDHFRKFPVPFGATDAQKLLQQRKQSWADESIIVYPVTSLLTVRFCSSQSEILTLTLRRPRFEHWFYHVATLNRWWLFYSRQPQISRHPMVTLRCQTWWGGGIPLETWWGFPFPTQVSPRIKGDYSIL